MTDPVLIVSGPPGAGKTATARILADSSERAVHLEADRFFTFIRAGYVAPWTAESHEQNTTVMRIVAGAAVQYADAGYFTVVDGIVIPRWFLGPVSTAVQDAGHDVAYAVLRAPLDTCVARAARRPEGALSDSHVIEGIWRQFQELGPLETHVIDTTSEPAEAVARAVRASIRDLSLRQ